MSYLDSSQKCLTRKHSLACLLTDLALSTVGDGQYMMPSAARHAVLRGLAMIFGVGVGGGESSVS